MKPSQCRGFAWYNFFFVSGGYYLNGVYPPVNWHNVLINRRIETQTSLKSLYPRVAAFFNVDERCNRRVYSFQHKSPSRRKYSFGSTNSQCSDDDNDSEVGSISSERSYGSRVSRNHHKVLEPDNVSYSPAHISFERFSFSKKLGC